MKVQCQRDRQKRAVTSVHCTPAVLMRNDVTKNLGSRNLSVSTVSQIFNKKFVEEKTHCLYRKEGIRG